MPVSTKYTLLAWQVGVIGNLVHSSPNIKKEVLNAGALQPVIGLLRYDDRHMQLMMIVLIVSVNNEMHITYCIYLLSSARVLLEIQILYTLLLAVHEQYTLDY